MHHKHHRLIIAAYMLLFLASPVLWSPNGARAQSYSAYGAVTSVGPNAISVAPQPAGRVAQVGVPLTIYWSGVWSGSDSFDIWAVSSAGKSLVASNITQSMANCAGSGWSACAYGWAPVASGQVQFTVSDHRGVGNAGVSSPYTVVAASSAPAYQTASLNASCSGAIGARLVPAPGQLVISWSAAATGGIAPYYYSWTAYDDAKPGYASSAQYMQASYGAAGTKWASVRVTDSRGTMVTASCAQTLSAAAISAAANAPSSVAMAPVAVNAHALVTAFYLSTNSAVAGQPVTLTATSYSPSSTLEAVQIDSSSDAVNWVPGSPCAVWTSQTGADSAHSVSCSFVPPAGGAYYFRAHGTDASAPSSYVYQTLMASQPAAVQTASSVGSASILAASCLGTPGANLSINWSAQAALGKAPYDYSWTMNDADASGYTSSAQYTPASYSSATMKTAVVNVTDAMGNTASAMCSALPAPQAASQAGSASPNVTLDISSYASAGRPFSISSTAYGPDLTHHGVEVSADQGSTWNVVATWVPQAGVMRSAWVTLPSIGTYLLRAYAGNPIVPVVRSGIDTVTIQ